MAAWHELTPVLSVLGLLSALLVVVPVLPMAFSNVVTHFATQLALLRALGTWHLSTNTAPPPSTLLPQRLSPLAMQAITSLHLGYLLTWQMAVAGLGLVRPGLEGDVPLQSPAGLPVFRSTRPPVIATSLVAMVTNSSVGTMTMVVITVATLFVLTFAPSGGRTGWHRRHGGTGHGGHGGRVR